MGEWSTTAISYVQANRVHCDLCGQPIAGRYWTVAIEGLGRRCFCQPDHERKYIEYWLPRYGATTGTA
jgi:hypothetical protein